jgi:hypothetical protein
LEGGLGVKKNISATSMELTTPLSTGSGGTGMYTYKKGDILYSSQANVLSPLGIGLPGQLLTVNANGIPEWKSPTANATTINVSDTTESTSTTTGAAVIAGGLGVGGNIYSGGNVIMSGYICRGRRTVVTTGEYHIQESDYLISVKISGTVNLLLPEIDTLTVKEKVYVIKAETNNPDINVIAGGDDTIEDNLMVLEIDGNYNCLTIYCDGINSWYIM